MNKGNNDTSEKLIVGFIIACLAILFVVLGVLIIYRSQNPQKDVATSGETGDGSAKVLSSEEAEASSEYESHKVDYVDADAYFAETSQIVAVIKVNESTDVLTESETAAFLEDRGFSGMPITSQYDMEGVYYDEEEISADLDTKHPMYNTYYVSENDEVWVISVIDGDVVAVPVSYNLQSMRGVQLVIAESETVTSYDSVTNQFYKNIPNEEILLVRVVDRIDAETLNALTVEVIDGL